MYGASFLGMSHGTTPAAVTTNKNIIMSSFKSSRDIQRKKGGPDSHFKLVIFDYLCLLCLLLQKLDNRTNALKAKQSWDEEKKKKIVHVLKMDYMSSEEERESDGEPYFAVKRVPWRSDELEEVMKELDKKSQTLKSTKGKSKSANVFAPISVH